MRIGKRVRILSTRVAITHRVSGVVCFIYSIAFLLVVSFQFLCRALLALARDLYTRFLRHRVVGESLCTGMHCVAPAFLRIHRVAREIVEEKC